MNDWGVNKCISTIILTSDSDAIVHFQDNPHILSPETVTYIDLDLDLHPDNVKVTSHPGLMDLIRLAADMVSSAFPFTSAVK